MSKRVDFTLTAPDGAELACYEWPCENAKAAVVVVHGMAEHASRYGRFASALNNTGLAVVSMDLRGHGASIHSVKGWFAKKDGGAAVLEDIRRLCLWAKNQYPSVPLVLFGHSMGSIFARAALFSFGALFRAAVLSGVTVDIPGRRDIAPLIAGAVSLFSGGKSPSPMLDNLTFGAYNNAFKPARTKFDWLSRDTAEVDKYVADENCGFICTGSMFVDVSRMLLATLKKDNVAKMPRDVPIFIVSGAKDPVGGDGMAAAFLGKQYKALGIDVQTKIYEDCRHELLNEMNRDEVTEDVIGFINEHIAG